MSDIKRVGQKIQSLCDTKKITLDELAERCSLTTAVIEKIMEGKYLPSIGTLIRISRCLGERLGSLLDDQENLGPVIYRKGETKLPLGFTDKEKAENLDMEVFPLAASKSGRTMEPFIIHLNASSNKEFQLSNHEGEEFMYVLNGTVEISYGNDSYIISQGESIYYDSIISHNVHCLNDSGATVLAVIYAPY